MRLTAPDGTQAGERIEGSKLYRAFCDACSDPIRVNHSDIGKPQRCQTCRGAKPPASTPEEGMRRKARQRNREDLGPVQVRRQKPPDVANEPFDYKRWGRPGAPIAGSRLYRAYTADGQPYRTTDPDHPGGLKPGSPGVCHSIRCARSSQTDDATPSGENAVRALEERG